jgi:hypothetical protein
MVITNPTFRRHDVFARYDRALAEREQWKSTRFIARQLLVSLEHPTLVGDASQLISRAEAARQFARLFPRAVERIGEAVVAGAVPERSACRWCASTLWATVHKRPRPNAADPGVRMLLGEPCSHTGRLTRSERRAMMAKLNARVALSRTAVRRRQQAALVEQQRALVASGGNRPFVIGDPASWRAWAREDVANRAPWASDVRLDSREGRYRTHSPACTCEGCEGLVTYANTTTTGTWTR